MIFRPFIYPSVSHNRYTTNVQPFCSVTDYFSFQRFSNLDFDSPYRTRCGTLCEPYMVHETFINESFTILLVHHRLTTECTVMGLSIRRDP